MSRHEGFAFIPNRFLREGFLSSMVADELRLYVLLVLAGDRSGQSFYHYDKLCSLLELTLDAYVDARNGLIERDLVAHDRTRFQVLSLPSAPKSRAAPAARDEDLDAPDATEIRRAILSSFGRLDG